MIVRPGLAQDWKRTCTGAYVRWLLRAGLKWKRTRVADPSDSGFIFSVAGTAEQCKENRRGKDTKVMEESLPAWQSLGSGEDRAVAGVEGGAEEENGRDSANNLGKVAGFVFMKRATEERFLAVAEPLLEDLVAAKGVFPHIRGDGGPECRVVEVDIDAARAEESESIIEG